MAKSKNQQEAYNRIGILTEHFAEQIEVLKKTQNETETRIQFINPLFDALGWDIDNTKRRAIDSDKDVVHEDKILVSGKMKAPDYSFRIAGKRKFFLEAKKPAILIKTDFAPSYQLRRYGWSAKLPVSILTDFEEFALYDCTKLPKNTDTAATGRLKYLSYQQYLSEFNWLWDLFAKEQVLKGSLEQFAKTDKKGTQSVDYAFLQSLDEWRNLLAINIALRNKQLSEEEINHIVQININRIVFLRNCEDRGVEPYGKLKNCLSQSKTEGAYFKNLYQIFEEADRKYNSGLFDFTKDIISNIVAIDNKVIGTIVSELYYPKSPYEFSVIGAEILGTAYERFLGKVIRLTPAHQAKIEEKPEVRKAGGVFYTPQYIVEYIVNNTVGKLIANKTPQEIERIKICDPACGSGSFLLGAYQYLLNYYTDWYTKNYKKSRNIPTSPLTPDGSLNTQIKKQILLNNIYGVDIDAQAVEVTKLSLLMKCMEGETASSMQTTMVFERILPTLDNNIKSGNSLIDFDFYEGQLNFAEVRKINPFNWKLAFPEVFKPRKHNVQNELKRQYNWVVDKEKEAENRLDNLMTDFENYVEEPAYDYAGNFVSSGFDVIIGNPPYGALFTDEAKNYLKRQYQTFVWRGESYLLFIEKALQLLSRGGLLGFIIPDTYLNLQFTQPVRTLLLQSSKISEITVLPSNVFADASVDTTLLITQKAEKAPYFHKGNIQVNIFGKKEVLTNLNTPQKTFYASTEKWFTSNNFNVTGNESELAIIQKTDRLFPQLETLAEINYGIKAYQVGKGKPPQTATIRTEKPFTAAMQMAVNWLPFYDGKHIGRYEVFWKQNNWINYGPWLAEPRKPLVFEGEKLLIRKIIGKTLIATYIAQTSYCNTLLFILKLKNSCPLSYKFVLGVLNSYFIGWYFRKKFQIAHDDTFPQIMIKDLLQFSFPANPSKAAHNEIVQHVETLLQLNANLQTETNVHKKAQMQGRIAFAEQRINAIVYQLYDLTHEEIQIIESE